MYKKLLIILLLLAPVAWAAEMNSSQATPATSQHNTDAATQQATTTPSTLRVCPNPEELIKEPDTLIWTAQNKQWKSYDKSFVDKVETFNGAQWHGVNVGQIFCVYEGSPKPNFPIVLVYSTLALNPSGGLWEEDKGGYRNCKTNDPGNCPFQIRYRQPTPDLYQQVKGLKGAPEPGTNP